MIRVLLVDDDAIVRAGLRLMLGGAPDIELVAEGADGSEVPALVAAHGPDLVLMDVRMPGVDGLAATEALRARPGAPEVLVLTTFHTDEHVLRALRAGAAGFLLKDTPPQEIVTAIRTVAAGDPVLSPAVTRRLIDQVAGGTGQGSRAATARPAGTAGRARTGGGDGGRAGPVQCGDRTGTPPGTAHGEDPRVQDPDPPRPQQPRPDRPVGPRRGRTGLTVRPTVERLPSGGVNKPVWLCRSGTGAATDGVDRCWQAFLHRFDVEQTFRLLKQTLGWTRPKMRDSRAADRWKWLVLAAHAQLRLAHPLARDLRLPWERSAEPNRLTPRNRRVLHPTRTPQGRR